MLLLQVPVSKNRARILTVILLIPVVVLIAITCGPGKTEAEVSGQKPPAGYFPGLGEMMKSLQYHHAKLYFGGNNKNWPLADFELHELVEGVEEIQKFHHEKPEISTISRIQKDFQALKAAVEHKDNKNFQAAFRELTQTCNSCHSENSHGFIVITVPTILPVSNQDFRPSQK